MGMVKGWVVRDGDVRGWGVIDGDGEGVGGERWGW